MQDTIVSRVPHTSDSRAALNVPPLLSRVPRRRRRITVAGAADPAGLVRPRIRPRIRPVAGGCARALAMVARMAHAAIADAAVTELLQTSRQIDYRM